MRFRLDIENNGKCRDIVALEVTDLQPGCLSYEGGATLYCDGEEYGANPPDEITEAGGGLQLTWSLGEIEALAPGESIAIEYDAIVEEPGANTNLAIGSAHCGYDYSKIISDADTATVFVTPPSEEVLPAAYEAHDAGGLWRNLRH